MTKAVADVVEDLAAIRLLAGSNVDETRAGHAAAIGCRAEDAGKVVQAGRRKGETVVRAIEARAVGHGCHFDRRLGAVGEGVVKLRI
ncbi:hypothetical protein QO002_001195 [Pararhizobium capsulatum DSM 1112]|uniref:Uncharacterized protein n=1 Tax=Pararhizobium capsulatum DSM 1112 TaxID=1121113 RepID=A0ABU0BQB7_9HYPH|nr:hypothetical protein [Pararhizobium capsulatum DSM 1112]